MKLRYNQIRRLTGDKQRSGLNLSILRNLEIPIPKMDLQKKFSIYMKEVEKIRNNKTISKELIENLSNSIAKKVFKII